MPRAPHLIFQDNALLDTARQAGLLDHMRHAGGQGIQQDVKWGDVYKNGAYDWSKYDALVNAARARGMDDIAFRIYGTPAYQHGADNTLSAATPNAVLAGKFAEEAARHFAGRVKRYGVWNEPNVYSFLNPQGPGKYDPREAASAYRQIYRQMRSSIKGADPRAQVGFGELTAQAPDTRGPQSTLGFLRAVLAAGKKPLRADYVSIHPYQWSDPRKHMGGEEYGGISNLAGVQHELARQAAAGRLVTSKGGRVPLSLSEFGYKHDAAQNPAVRARWMREALRMAQEAGVRDVNLYQLVPSKAGDYWDSSIANEQGAIDPRMLSVLQAFKRGRGVRPR